MDSEPWLRVWFSYLLFGTFTTAGVMLFSVLPFRRVVTTTIGAVLGTAAAVAIAHWGHMECVQGALWPTALAAGVLSVVLVVAFSIGDPLDLPEDAGRTLGVIALFGAIMLAGQLLSISTEDRPLELGGLVLALVIGALFPVIATVVGCLLAAGPASVLAAISGTD